MTPTENLEVPDPGLNLENVDELYADDENPGGVSSPSDDPDSDGIEIEVEEEDW